MLMHWLIFLNPQGFMSLSSSEHMQRDSYISTAFLSYFTLFIVYKDSGFVNSPHVFGHGPLGGNNLRCGHEPAENVDHK